MNNINYKMRIRIFRRFEILAFLVIGIILGSAGAVQAQTLMATDDSYGVRMDEPLIEEAGVLDNDTVDGENAGEAGASATLVSSVSYGTLECASTALELCDDGSFTYTPDASFTGLDSFTYEVAFAGLTAQATVTLTACAGGPALFTC